MPDLNSIAGRWRIASEMAEDEDEFIHIGSDGRLVHFVRESAFTDRHVPMTLWLTYVSQHTFEVRARPGEDHWHVSFEPSEIGIDIVRPNHRFPLTPAANDDLPDWFEERLEGVLLRMAQRAKDAS